MIDLKLNSTTTCIELLLPATYVGKRVRLIAFVEDENSTAGELSSNDWRGGDALHILSENSLKDWLSEEEDGAWKHLQ